MKTNWDLTVFYKDFDDPEFKDDLARLPKEIDAFTAAIAAPAEDEVKKLVSLVHQEEALSNLFERLSLMIELTLSVDANNKAANAAMAPLMRAVMGSSLASNAFSRYLASLENLDAIIDADDELKARAFALREAAEDAKHQLPEALEKPVLKMQLSGGEAFELERPVDFLLCARDGETAPPGAALNSAEQYYPVISDARWGGPKDLSGRLTAAWNDTSLRLSLEVTDDVHHQPFKADGPLFDGDSVQIGIDTLCNRSVNYDNDDYELCFGLTRNGPEFSVFAAPGGMAERLKKQAVFKAVREGEITRYDIELPWSALGVKPKRGMKLGFSFLVNDNDGAVRKGFLQWTSGIGPRKDPRQFGTLILW